MNKILKWLLILLIVLVVLFFGFYYKNNLNNKTNLTNNKIEKKDHTGIGMAEKIDLDDVVKKIKMDYKSDPYFQECIAMDIGVQSCLRDVIQRRVNEEDNVKYCDDLISGQDLCRENYYAIKAEKTGDPSICDKIGENKNYCLENVYKKKAVEAGDEAICDSLTEEYSKETCKKNAIREIAIKTNNEKLCEKLLSKVEGENDTLPGVYTNTIDMETCKDEVRMNMEIRAEEESIKAGGEVQ